MIKFPMLWLIKKLILVILELIENNIDHCATYEIHNAVIAPATL